MPLAFEANKTTIVLRDGKFVECVFVHIDYERQVTAIPGGAIIKLDGEELTKYFDEVIPGEFDFLVLNLKAGTAIEQIVGCARQESHYIDPTPSDKVYFFA